MTITALAAEIGVNRTVVYRLVATLEQHGLARRDGSGRLHVGLGVLALTRGLQPVLRELASPVLRALAEQIGSTAHLTVADGGEALAIAVVEPSWTDYHVAYRVGARHPLEQGAAGKAILLGRSPRGAPYVETVGEIQPGARGIAAPVLGVEGLRGVRRDRVARRPRRRPARSAGRRRGRGRGPPAVLTCPRRGARFCVREGAEARGSATSAVRTTRLGGSGESERRASAMWVSRGCRRC